MQGRQNNDKSAATAYMTGRRRRRTTTSAARASTTITFASTITTSASTRRRRQQKCFNYFATNDYISSCIFKGSIIGAFYNLPQKNQSVDGVFDWYFKVGRFKIAQNTKWTHQTISKSGKISPNLVPLVQDNNSNNVLTAKSRLNANGRVKMPLKRWTNEWTENKTYLTRPPSSIEREREKATRWKKVENETE